MMSNIKKKVFSKVKLNSKEAKMLNTKQKSIKQKSALKAQKEPPIGMTVRVDSDGGKLELKKSTKEKSTP